jgi:hypothetical protein
LYGTALRGSESRRTPEERPSVCAFNMDMDERWFNRSPETMLETFHFFRGECFDRIVEGLLERARRSSQFLLNVFTIFAEVSLPF